MTLTRKTIYYAHPMSWYGTDAEKRDIEALSSYGEVINPNTERFQQLVEKAKHNGWPVMQVFADYIRDVADVVAFRRFDDWALGAGVAREVLEARIWGKEVWEVFGPVGGDPAVTQYPYEPFVGDTPSLNYIMGDVLTVEETRKRIAEGRL